MVAGSLQCSVYLEVCFVVLGLAYLGLASLSICFFSLAIGSRCFSFFFAVYSGK